MSLNYIIEPITRENLYDFRQVILPDVLPELAGIPDDDLAEAICCGARLDGEPCGAVVCSLLEDELFIDSLYVVPPLRRNGIGNGLLEYACAMALGATEKTKSYQKLQVYCEYSLPEPDATDFRAFLHDFGCNNFTINLPVYYVKPQHLDGGVEVTALSELDDVARKQFLAINEKYDLSFVPEISFAEKDADNSRQFILTQSMGDNAYMMATETDVVVTEEEYEAFVRSALSRILDYDPKATVLIKAEFTPYDPVWERLAAESGSVCSHVVATAYRLYTDN